VVGREVGGTALDDFGIGSVEGVGVVGIGAGAGGRADVVDEVDVGVPLVAVRIEEVD